LIGNWLKSLTHTHSSLRSSYDEGNIGRFIEIALFLAGKENEGEIQPRSAQSSWLHEQLVHAYCDKERSLDDIARVARALAELPYQGVEAPETDRLLQDYNCRDLAQVVDVMRQSLPRIQDDEATAESVLTEYGQRLTAVSKASTNGQYRFTGNARLIERFLQAERVDGVSGKVEKIANTKDPHQIAQALAATGTLEIIMNDLGLMHPRTEITQDQSEEKGGNVYLGIPVVRYNEWVQIAHTKSYSKRMKKKKQHWTPEKRRRVDIDKFTLMAGAARQISAANKTDDKAYRPKQYFPLTNDGEYIGTLRAQEITQGLLAEASPDIAARYYTWHSLVDSINDPDYLLETLEEMIPDLRRKVWAKLNKEFQDGYEIGDDDQKDQILSQIDQLEKNSGMLRQLLGVEAEERDTETITSLVCQIQAQMHGDEIGQQYRPAFVVTEIVKDPETGKVSEKEYGFMRLRRVKVGDDYRFVCRTGYSTFRSMDFSDNIGCMEIELNSEANSDTSLFYAVMDYDRQGETPEDSFLTIAEAGSNQCIRAAHAKITELENMAEQYGELFKKTLYYGAKKPKKELTVRGGGHTRARPKRSKFSRYIEKKARRDLARSKALSKVAIEAERHYQRHNGKLILPPQPMSRYIGYCGRGVTPNRKLS